MGHKEVAESVSFSLRKDVSSDEVLSLSLNYIERSILYILRAYENGEARYVGHNLDDLVIGCVASAMYAYEIHPSNFEKTYVNEKANAAITSLREFIRGEGKIEHVREDVHKLCGIYPYHPIK